LAWFAGGRERPSLRRVLEALNKWREPEGGDVVVLNEAQELAKLRGNLLPVLAYSYDNPPRLKFVVGSREGMLYRFLKLGDAKSTRYSRYAPRVEVRPLLRRLAVEYLQRGFETAGIG